MNLAQAISQVAGQQPDAPAFIMDRDRLTYRELDAGIRNIAAALANGGVARGEVVGVSIGNTPLLLVTVLALASLGALALPIAAPLSARERNDLVRRYDVARLVSDDQELVGADVPTVLVPRGWRKETVAAPIDPAPASLPWIVVMSSGTTGTPKAITFQQDETIEYSRRFQGLANCESGPGTRMLFFGSLQTAFVLRPCMRHLLHGGAVVFPGSSLHKEAVDLLQRKRVTHATMSPHLLGSICRLIGENGLYLPDMQHLAVGGAAVSPKLIQIALSRLTPNIYVHYGASEVGLVALADPKMPRDHPGNVGRLVSWLNAEAVDEQDRPIAVGRSGALRFRGEGMVREYLRDREASERVFRGGWFYSGDTGSIGADGLVRLEGRVDDRINLRGAKFNPGDIERVIDSHPLVRESAAFTLRGKNGKLRLYAAVVANGPLTGTALRAHCSRELSGARLPERFFGVRSLPRNPNGKLLRSELPGLARRRPPQRA